MVQTHEFKVSMSCEGCSGAVERVLNKHKDKGIESVACDLKDQTVKVKTTMTSEEVLTLIKKTGKECEFLKSS